MAKDRIPEEKLAELRAKHSDVVVVDTKFGDCVFRSPNRSEYERWQSILFKESSRSKASVVLCTMTLVYPDAATFNAYADKAPGIFTTCASPILELAGVDGEAEVKKYES